MRLDRRNLSSRSDVHFRYHGAGSFSAPQAFIGGDAAKMTTLESVRNGAACPRRMGERPKSKLYERHRRGLRPPSFPNAGNNSPF